MSRDELAHTQLKRDVMRRTAVLRLRRLTGVGGGANVIYESSGSGSCPCLLALGTLEPTPNRQYAINIYSCFDCCLNSSAQVQTR